MLAALQNRMEEAGLRLHPAKTRIVYCQDGGRRGSHEHTSFTFLGFTFRARAARGKNGVKFTSFLPAVSKDALAKMSAEVRSWRLHRRTWHTMGSLAREINPAVRGSPGGLSLSHHVAPERSAKSFCNTSRGRSARCCRCSEALPARTCHMHDNLQGNGGLITLPLSAPSARMPDLCRS